jgi:hypothetical protein
MTRAICSAITSTSCRLFESFADGGRRAFVTRPGRRPNCQERRGSLEHVDQHAPA